ncbi:esterase-like activity of phytase family protein [Polaribacter sargassicola]|uniref:esterase-like activity of phytase family protein n=1 Tax=Polaribacter sargassicola TaxID=2836891 RepID=UPI001F42026B|nr:esterase-like activity of phytase family protein [Polaribacter sp. DS7-9]MCG1036375.1 esterase-like activity of phytase family protein [Polaribacter sp. DS7-9]
MRKIFLVAIIICVFLSCKTTKELQLNFLDEYILADSLKLNNEKIGGLSGVDFANNQYYFVVDDAKNPRVLSGDIIVANNKITAVDFKKSIYLKDSTSQFYQENVLDLESVFVDEETGAINLTSEGSINYNKTPSVFNIDKNGKFLESFQLPKSLSNLKTIKHNAVLEGSSKSFDKKGFWVAMEGVLTVDGEEPTFTKQSSPIRITYYDKTSKNATKQFAYQLEHITKPAKGKINLNGVTAILEYQKNRFFIVERTYQSGYESYGNIIRIFDVVLDDEVTNILNVDSLKSTKFVPLKKRLVFNFEDVKDKLTDRIIDNIEGITFGSKLPNGNQTLILISDDNFQLYGKQLNQFILLEIQK